MSSPSDDADRVDLELAALDAIEATEDAEVPPGTRSLARARRAWAVDQLSLLRDDHQGLS